MAKEDFCFTYYDGDATRDMSHMTRLERGCYTDIIISIRKFGHLTLDQCKKILSKDFEDNFPAIELILKKDEAGNYYIEWLENSLVKSKKHSEKQKNNRLGTTKQQPNNNQNTILDAPLEDVYGNGDNKEKESEKTFFSLKGLKPGKDHLKMELPDIKIEASQQYFASAKGLKNISVELILSLWSIFKVKEFTGEKEYRCESDIHSHFINQLKYEKLEDVKSTAIKRTGKSDSEIRAWKILNNEEV